VRPPSKDKVQQVLKRLEQELYRIVRGAWQDWIQVSQLKTTKFSRTRANWVWDRMIYRACEAFSEDLGIRCVERFNSASFIVDNDVLFRFKKGDFKGLSHNVQTQLALAFHDHSITLFDDIDFMRVEVVYVLNQLETQIERVCVVGRDKADVIWAYDIVPHRGTVEEIPTVEVEKTPPEQLVQIRETMEDVKVINRD
jgi:hypothetical protein